MPGILMVPVIMLCAVLGTIGMLALCGCSRWGFIYLIRYRLLKREVKQSRYAVCMKHDILSAIIAVITLITVVLLLIYGVPFVAKHIDLSKIPMPDVKLP